MTLHLLKLCVGAGSIGDLERWIAQGRAFAALRGRAFEQVHTTRMVPKRAAELLDGGSLHWVIKGRVAARQRFLALRPFTDEGGIGRCHLVLDPLVVPVAGGPCRPFQGWRYLAPDAAPPDLAPGGGELPEALRRELGDLGLL